MTGDQWFTLWMTLISTLGGGAVTLAGVLIALRHGRRQQAADAALAIERDRQAAYREELKHRRYQLQDWRQAVVQLIRQCQAVVGNGIGEHESSGKMLDRPDYIETFVRHAASMVLGPWQENPPMDGTDVHRIMWPIIVEINAFRERRYSRAQRVLDAMDELRIWLEDTGLPSIQAAITRLDEEISEDVQGSAAPGVDTGGAAEVGA